MLHDLPFPNGDPSPLAQQNSGLFCSPTCGNLETEFFVQNRLFLDHFVVVLAQFDIPQELHEHDLMVPTLRNVIGSDRGRLTLVMEALENWSKPQVDPCSAMDLGERMRRIKGFLESPYPFCLLRMARIFMSSGEQHPSPGSLWRVIIRRCSLSWKPTI